MSNLAFDKIKMQAALRLYYATVELNLTFKLNKNLERVPFLILQTKKCPRKKASNSNLMNMSF